MKFFENIKDYFAPAYSKRFANPDEDIKILSQIGRESFFLKASNGKKYYYYFPRKRHQIDVAQYLLRRNGINVKKHSSYYFYEPCMSLRVLERNVYKDSRLVNFVKSIAIDSHAFGDYELILRLNAVEKQMQGKTK